MNPNKIQKWNKNDHVVVVVEIETLDSVVDTKIHEIT